MHCEWGLQKGIRLYWLFSGRGEGPVMPATLWPEYVLWPEYEIIFTGMGNLAE